MSQPRPLPSEPLKADADHLQLLAIFHFVAAGLAVLGILGLIAHHMVFRIVMEHPRMAQLQGPDPALMRELMKWMYAIMGAWFVASGVLNLAAGMSIRARKRRTFTLFVAGMNCLHFPLGTVLGVFTFVVLLRDSVQELYNARASAWASGEY